MRGFLNRSKQVRKGAAVVELAVSLPVILIMMFGAIEVCNSIALRKSLTVAAYEGSMVAVLPNAKSCDVQQAVDQVLSDRGVVADSINITPANLEDAPVGASIKIEVVANYDDNCIVLSTLFNSTPIRGTATFVKEF